MLSDETLAVQAARLKDTLAYGELVRRHRPRVLLLLTRLCKNSATAEDLTQDAFLRAWQKIESFNASGRFLAWLSRIAYREFLMHARKRKDESLNSADEPHTTPALHAQPELARVLALVDDEEATLLILSFAWQLSHSEISDLTGLPTGTTKSKIHRAKEKIRAQLAITGAA